MRPGLDLSGLIFLWRLPDQMSGMHTAFMAFVVPVAALAIEFMVSERTIYDHREPQKARKIMTAKAKTMKPRKPATGQVRDAMHKK